MRGGVGGNIQGDEMAQEKQITPSPLHFIENTHAPFVTSNNSVVPREGESGEAHLYLLNSQFPDNTRTAAKRIPPLLLFNLIFHSRRVTGGAGTHFSLDAGEMKTKTCLRAHFFFLSPLLFLYPLLIQGRGRHTQKTLNR